MNPRHSSCSKFLLVVMFTSWFSSILVVSSVLAAPEGRFGFVLVSSSAAEGVDVYLFHYI